MGRRNRHAYRAPSAAVNLASRAKPPTAEKGSTGSITFGGVMSGLDQDYSDAWRLPNRWGTIEKMRADPAVTATLAALTYPILAAKLEVEAASDDPDDKRYAEFVEENLDGMTVSLARHRMEALGCVGDGVRVFETVYEPREDGLYHLRKLALRPNKTITEWKVDPTGGPDGVVQMRSDGRPEPLEMDRLLVFTHLGDGPSLLGRPATRPMYRPWWLIDRVSRAGAVAIDRHGAGVPWARYEGSNADDRRKVEHALMGLHTNERTYLLWNKDVTEWGIKGVEGTMMDPVPFMEYQRRDLFLAPLAQFLALGTDSIGSMALSQDHSSFFMMALRFIARQIEDTYSTYLVPRLIGYNWTVPADRLPRIRHATLDQRNIGTWTAAVAQLVAAGVPLPMAPIGRAAVELLGVTVPEAPTQPAADVADVNDPNAPETVNQSWPGVSLSDSGLVSPGVLAALGISVNFAEMTRQLDDVEAQIVAALAPLQEAQRRRLLIAAQGIVKRRDVEALRRFTVQSDQEREALEKILGAVYEFGADQVASELASQGATAEDPSSDDKEAAAAFLAVTAGEMARALADRMRTAWGTAVVGQMRTGYDKTALEAAVTAPGERLLADVARQATGVAFATGRADAAQANKAAIGKEVWSAVMDDGTCSGSPAEHRCRQLDGQTFAVGEGPACPNANCKGGYRCRCVRIAVASGS